MHLPAKVWSCLNYLTSILTLSSLDQPDLQQPIGGHVKPVTIPVKPLDTATYPIFKPPGGRVKYAGSGFNCSYPDMPDYEFCGDDPDAPGCWLRPIDGNKSKITYDIFTDYENYTPKGRVQKYNFTITDGEINADGFSFANGKLVNGQYPGPWVQACWGDRIEVTVTNKMKFNGTAVHWHGIRQLESMEMDGVPGITQCPIAPNDTFVYSFRTQQYGSAWYHSHYSVQYADGLLGPMTIHGPHSAEFDEARLPTLMSDWFHNSAYSAIHGSVPKYQTILLNGTGDIRKYQYYNLTSKGSSQLVGLDRPLPAQYRLHLNATKVETKIEGVMRPQRYLLRLVNTAFDTTFVFSIDNHKMKVISADFVAIKPYMTTHLHIGIGQRYNVIVEAEPIDYGEGDTGYQRKHFWIRTTPSSCFGAINKLAPLQGYDQTGVLTYIDPVDDDPFTPIVPVTRRWAEVPENPSCRDENSTSLEPIHPWKIGPPVNKDPIKPWNNDKGEKDVGETFGVVGSFMFKPQKVKPNDFPIATFSLERAGDVSNWDPLQIDYLDPIIRHLHDNDTQIKAWPRKWGVVHENHTEGSWVYLALAGTHPTGKSGGKNTAGAHPMHLHGHDFAILQQEFNKTLSPENIKLNKTNPARRDVVLLPENGFVVIAFKMDNPGSWIMHCHIAFHASEGLGLQVMENQYEADKLWPPSGKTIAAVNKTCTKWKEFQDDCTKHWPGYNEKYKCYPACTGDPFNACETLFQDDSGVKML